MPLLAYRQLGFAHHDVGKFLPTSQAPQAKFDTLNLSVKLRIPQADSHFVYGKIFSPGGMAERLKAHVLKTCLGHTNVGSNPTPSARRFAIDDLQIVNLQA